MSFPTLRQIEIPQGSPNAYGITVQIGHFDRLEVVVPEIKNRPTFGFTTVKVNIDGNPAQSVVLGPEHTGPVLVEIPPYAVRCCWQKIDYTVTIFGNEEHSEAVMVLNEGKKSKSV
ncbi:hypothetical protein KUA23_23485 [Pseudomonas pergaminensis]|uniref:Uncharacterized protein n=1 Tax=Pseudomonas pergaminensis TaxID=2853159 RepID=A0ABD7TE74_9PSED|nr:hypothetical protein [Pseudomonas pergaminensis]USV99957.1 hypothetical protein KUA23_23485 [Pseudomonas pergaminensis]